MAYLSGKTTTGGEPTQNVKVHAFRSGSWGAPSIAISDIDGNWKIDGLLDNVPYDLAFVHPAAEWEGKMSSRRMPIFDPFADPFWEDTVVLCQFDDVSGQAFINEREVANFNKGGTGTIIVSENAKFGNGAVQFPLGGSGNYYGFGSSGTGNAGSPVFMGASDEFTAEGWFWTHPSVTTGYRDILIMGSSDRGLVINSSNQIGWYDGGMKAVLGDIGSSGLDLYGRWAWVVIQRNAGFMTIWLDGIRRASFTDTAGWNSFRLGSNTSNSEQFFGMMDSWRFTRAARYDRTQDLTVPIGPYVKGNPIREDLFQTPSRIWNYQNTGTWTISGGRYTSTASSGQNISVRRDFSAKNFFAECNIFQSVTSGFIWRWTDASNFYQMTISDDQATSSGVPNLLRVYKWVSGTATKIGDDMVVNLPRGSTNKVRVEMVDNLMTFTVNNTVIGSITDNSLTSAGRIGFQTGAGSGYSGSIEVGNFTWDTLL